MLTQLLVLKEQERGKEREVDDDQMVRKCSVGIYPINLYNEGSDPQRLVGCGAFEGEAALISKRLQKTFNPSTMWELTEM